MLNSRRLLLKTLKTWEARYRAVCTPERFEHISTAYAADFSHWYVERQEPGRRFECQILLLKYISLCKHLDNCTNAKIAEIAAFLNRQTAAMKDKALKRPKYMIGFQPVGSLPFMVAANGLEDLDLVDVHSVISYDRIAITVLQSGRIGRVMKKKWLEQIREDLEYDYQCVRVKADRIKSGMNGRQAAYRCVVMDTMPFHELVRMRKFGEQFGRPALDTLIMEA